MERNVFRKTKEIPFTATVREIKSNGKVYHRIYIPPHVVERDQIRAGDKIRICIQEVDK